MTIVPRACPVATRASARAVSSSRYVESMTGRIFPASANGFAVTKMNLPFETADDIGEVAESMLRPFPANEYPNLVEFLQEHVMKPGYDYGDEFEYGLELILEGLEPMRNTNEAAPVAAD